MTWLFGGDTRTSETDRRAVSEQAVLHEPLCIVAVGDYVTSAGSATDWYNFLRQISNGIPGGEWITPNGFWIPIIPGIGNHESYSGGFVAYDALYKTAHYYTTRVGPILFIVIDHNLPDSVNSMTNFISTKLQEARNDPTIKWTYVINHYPGFNSRKDRSPWSGIPGLIGLDSDSPNVRKYYYPRMERYGATAYIVGHDHSLKVTKPLFWADEASAIKTTLTTARMGIRELGDGRWGAPATTSNYYHIDGSGMWYYDVSAYVDTDISTSTANHFFKVVQDGDECSATAIGTAGQTLASFDLYPKNTGYIGFDNNPANGRQWFLQVNSDEQLNLTERFTLWAIVNWKGWGSNTNQTAAQIIGKRGTNTCNYALEVDKATGCLQVRIQKDATHQILVRTIESFPTEEDLFVAVSFAMELNYGSNFIPTNVHIFWGQLGSTINRKGIICTEWTITDSVLPTNISPVRIGATAVEPLNTAPGADGITLSNYWNGIIGPCGIINDVLWTHSFDSPTKTDIENIKLHPSTVLHLDWYSIALDRASNTQLDGTLNFYAQHMTGSENGGYASTSPSLIRRGYFYLEQALTTESNPEQVQALFDMINSSRAKMQATRNVDLDFRFTELVNGEIIDPLYYEPDAATYRSDFYYNARLNTLFSRKWLVRKPQEGIMIAIWEPVSR